MQAFVAGLTCIARINRNHFNARTNTFVGQELAQLIERPTIGTKPLSLASRHLVGTISNPRQVLDGEDSITRSCLLDDGFADYMIFMCLKTSLVPRQPLQNLTASAPCRSCAFRCFTLKRSSSSGISISDCGNVLTAPFFALASYGNICTSKVYTNYLARFNRFWWCVFDLNMDVVATISMFAELGSSRLLTFELACLVLPHIHFDVVASIHQREADSPIFFPKSKDSSIVVSTGWLERFNWLALELGSFAISTNPHTSADCQVSAKPKVRAQLLINRSLNRGLASGLWLNYLIGIVASSRKRLKGCLYLGDLFWRGIEFAFLASVLVPCQLFYHM